MNPRFFIYIVKRPICTRYQSGNGGNDGGGGGGGSGLGGIDDRRKVQQQQHRGVVDDGGSRSLFSSQLPGGYSIDAAKAYFKEGTSSYKAIKFERKNGQC
ncbi:hypothetical protein C5167_004378 [Papaver somniferum]|uniref:Uncharacterized protein n=1 Tax=Papaver somniferum TaxID=3469 RepID=A0A4Y7J9B7_PAPSO|nr:hypothetical protein C5167_004378 [Papaver somniferum]